MMVFHVRHIQQIAYSLFLMGCLSADFVRAQAIPVQGTQIDVDIRGNVYILNAERNTIRLYDEAGAL